MKKFEHEVLYFDAQNKKSLDEMQQTLREWGEVGFEVVSVVHSNFGLGENYAIFLKRAVTTESNEAETAA